MSQVTGIIEQKNSREVNTKFGPKPSYSVKINGEWYSAGFKPCPYEEGQAVTANYTMNGKYKNITGYEAAPAGTTASPAPAASHGTGGGGYQRAAPEEFPLQADHPKRTIVRQNSLAHATALVSCNLVPDAGLSDAEIAERVIQMAYMFEEYSTGERETKVAEGLVDDGFPV